MILEKMFDVGMWIINAILNLLDVLPQFPESLVSHLNAFFDLLFDNLTVLGFFVPVTTLKVLIPLLLVVLNFERLYTFVMWVLRKIPMLGIR